MFFELIFQTQINWKTANYLYDINHRQDLSKDFKQIIDGVLFKQKLTKQHSDIVYN